MGVLFSLLQTMAVFLVVAYIYSKSPWFRPLTNENLSTRDKVYLYFFFSAISMMGTVPGPAGPRCPCKHTSDRSRAGRYHWGTNPGNQCGIYRRAPPVLLRRFHSVLVRPVNNHRRIDRWPCAPVSVPAKQAGSNLSSDGRFFYHDVR